MLEALQKLLEQIPGGENAVVLALAGVLDLVLRLVPSDKPRGVFQLMSGALRLLVAILDKVARLLDAVVPQRLKDDAKLP